MSIQEIKPEEGTHLGAVQLDAVEQHASAPGGLGQVHDVRWLGRSAADGRLVCSAETHLSKQRTQSDQKTV